MARPTNLHRAERAIAEMPNDYWVDVRSLSKNAGLTVQTMSKFLIRARKNGTVENKKVLTRWKRLHLWRRIDALPPF
ncbi:MAG TPA: hypothetical protein VMS94_01055 [Acidobacteriota bacterium]|nr:hypothetical protein [Acidobacteriota bacterium]